MPSPKCAHCGGRQHSTPGAETDDNDTTYFIVHQLEVIQRAIRSLHEYLARKAGEVEHAELLMRQAPPRLAASLNHRQLALLSHALRHPGYGYTVQSHKRSHRVTVQTARTDLDRLANLRLVDKMKRGRAYVYHAPGDLRKRIQSTTVRHPPGKTRYGPRSSLPASTFALGSNNSFGRAIP